MVEVEKDWASRGVAGAGLGLGIAGTALGLLQNGSLGGILGGNNNCGGSAYVTRYDAEKDAKIAMLERSDEHFFLCDSSKLGARFPYRITDLSHITRVIDET